MVLAPDAKILYVSETINDQLGLNWVSFDLDLTPKTRFDLENDPE